MFHLLNISNSTLIVLSGVAAVFLTAELLRYQLHLRRLRGIPHRIHINGSRGKSSTTRLIGAAIRATGRPAITKTTGTAPRFILTDGSEIPLFRAGKPNIIEQVKVVKAAAAGGAEFLVAECMAITPEYISTLEDKLIRSTVGVITNVREDHLDVMGPTVYDVAVNLARSLPRNGVAFTAEKRWFPVLENEAKKRGTKLLFADAATVGDEEAAGFPYIEHKENIAIALAVGDYFGVPRKQALEAMYAAPPDPGVLRETVVTTEKGSIYFFNALAANDPDSSHAIWKMAHARRKGKGVAVFILRADRIQRTESFIPLCGALNAGAFILAGSPVAYVAAQLRKQGIESRRIIALEKPEAGDVVRALLKQADGDVVAVAMGNIVGLGERFVTGLQEHAVAGNGVVA